MHLLPNNERDVHVWLQMKKAQMGGTQRIQHQNSSLDHLGGKGAEKKKKKNLEHHLEGKLDKPNNVFDVEPYHTKKIGPHNQNMEHHEGPHSYPQRTMKHQKGCESLEELHRNENPGEA